MYLKHPFIFLSAIVLLTLPSCERHGGDPWHANGGGGNSGQDTEEYPSKEATFTAYSDTRSSLVVDGSSCTIEWDELDKIGIWDGKKMETFTNVTAPGSSGTFKGEVKVKGNPDDMFFTDYFFAVSPYPEEFTDEGNNITEYSFKLPNRLVSPEEGRLPKGSNISVAMVLAGLGGSLDFYNVLSFIRFTVKDVKVETMKVRAHSPMVGKVEINPISRRVQSGEKSRKDSAWVVSFQDLGDGSGVSEYYISALPGTYTADLFIATEGHEDSPTVSFRDCSFSTSRMQVTDYRTITVPEKGNCRKVSSLSQSGSYALVSDDGFDVIKLEIKGSDARVTIEEPGKESIFKELDISDLTLIPDGAGSFYLRYYDPSGIKADGNVFHNLFFSNSSGCLAPSRLDDPDLVPDAAKLRAVKADSYKIYLIEE